MFVYIADGFASTGAGTGIQTALTQTGKIERTVRIGNTLWSTARILLCIGTEAWITECHTIAKHRADIVGATRRTGTRITRDICQCTNWYTLQEGISGKSIETMTDGCMLAHITDGIDATDGAGAGIDALVIDAGQRLATIGIDVALRLAACLRTTKVAWQTRADGTIVRHFAFAIQATGTWHARIGLRCVEGKATDTRVTCESGIARANRMMLFHAAVSAVTACSRAGIVAAEAHACLVLWTIGIHLAFVAMTAS